MSDMDLHGRPEPPVDGDERATLLGFLEYQRATFAWKCHDLDASGLGATVGASSMTLGGMLKHLALVEDSWFLESLHGRALPSAWEAADFESDPDWEWHSAAGDSPEQLRMLWERAVARSRAAVQETLDSGDLSTPAARRWPDGRSPSIRWILCHMVEEYARHNGHADLIREAVDGSTGE
ncbi:MAG: DinB family protein [Acidimicrobiales bacterium]